MSLFLFSIKNYVIILWTNSEERIDIFMADNRIQLTYTNDTGVEQEVFPITKSEFVQFSDGKSLTEKINGLLDTQANDKVTISKDGLMSKEDKAKLDGMANYSHPAAHDANMITENADRRFVKDTDIKKWNDKADNTIATTSKSGLLSPEDKQKIDSIDSNFALVYEADTETINFRFK